MMKMLAAATVDMLSKVERLEREMNAVPQTVVSVHHCVNGGVYTRTGTIPADTAFIGAVHKKDHINVVVGDVTVVTESGPIRYTGHHVLATPAGSKRVAYAHSDTTWTTILRTDLTSIREIEAECVHGSENLQTQTLKGIESCS
jgi:helix-turn-helix protein